MAYYHQYVCKSKVFEFTNCKWCCDSHHSRICYSYLSVSIGSKRAAFSAGYILNKTPHATEKEIIIIISLKSTTVGISLK